MADQDAEMVGGISVQIGASHARLPSDLAAADRIIEAWAKDRYVTIRAQVVMPAQAQVQAAARQQATPTQGVVFGAKAAAASQSLAAQPAFIKAVNAELAKSGQSWNATTNEIESATKATRSQKTAIVEVQQAAAAPTAVNIDFAAAQNDAQSLLATMREVLATATQLATVRPPVATAGAGGPRRPRTARSATDDAELRRLSAENQAAGGAGLTSATFAPQLTQARQAQLAREEQERERAAAARQPRAVQAAAAVVPPRPIDAIEARRQRRLADLEAGLTTGAAGGGGLGEEDILRREEERVATSASQVARGRTPRTTASSFGGQFLFGGPARQQAEATARQSAAEQNLVRVRRLLNDPKIIRDSVAYRHATEEETVAETELANATKRVNDLSSGGTALRSLAAVTVAGAAFSLGFAAVGVVAREAAKGLEEYFEIQTGFGGTSSRVTTALGAQTLALHGNADAALAAAEAQAGISAASADALDAQLKLTTQIKAGAAAQQQASELFRAGYGVGNAPSGLFGSYGGVLGTGLFGQKGFTQQVQTDISAFTQKRGGTDILSAFSTGLDYLTSPGARQALAGPARQQGNLAVQGVNAALSIPDVVTNLLQGNVKGAAGAALSSQGIGPPIAANTQITAQGTAYINNLNDAAKRAAPVLGAASTAMYTFTTNAKDIDTATRAAAQAGDVYGVALAQQGFIVTDTAGKIAASGDAYKKLVEQFAVGAGITDVATLAEQSLAAERQRERESAASTSTIRAQQQFALPSIIGQIARTQQYATGVQQPTQFTLGALTNPNLPVGTGIAAQDQAKVAGALKEAQGLQATLNTEYAQGQQIIENTYKPAIVQNFGAAAGQAFQTALDAVTATGQRIAQIQAGISNEQAAYQAAQYNFQLIIAKRTLTDISGLTDHNFGVGQSQLGVLEGQNLQLSRESQQLQFALSQRQINYQTAVAGFSAPGVTPEERQANIAEAKLEASYAQKQLDIQRQMFGNQVKIVDIGNLRQGTDLLRQIGLLQQGRKVTLDTTAAEQSLTRLNQQQGKNVAQVGTYLSAVDNLASTAIGNIAQIEAAAGKAMAGIAVSILGQFGIFFGGVSQYLAAYNKQASTSGQTTPGGHPLPTAYASGGVIGLSGPTRIGDNAIAGEAGNESLIILSRPRSAEGYGTGGQTVVINFNGPVNANRQSDLDYISRAVLQSLGRTASTLGLRAVG